MRKSKKSGSTPNLQHFLVNKLRRISYTWPPRKEVIKNARVARGKYKCASCGGENFGPKEINVDHIEPVIDPHIGFKDWNSFIERLFCEAGGLQILCKSCHDYKSLRENTIRKQVKSYQEPDDEV